MHIKNKYLIFLSVFAVLFFVSSSVYALELSYPRIPGAIPPQDFIKTASTDEVPIDFIKYIFNLIILASGIIFFGALVYAGVQYLTSSGKPEKIISAKEKLTAVFFGLLILLSSSILLETISPQFTNLKIPALKPLEIVAQPNIQPIFSENIYTSIDFEMPLGRIIESIFETYISKIPEPQKEETPRITRFNNIIDAIEKNINALKKQSEDLKGYADQCSCQSTKPKTPCGGNISGNTTWKCGCASCSATTPVSSDPCRDVRGEIQDAENKNKEAINNLIAEQVKMEGEVLSLREELDRLERARKFLDECPSETLTSYPQFLLKKDFFASQKYTLEQYRFWNDINIIHNKLLSGEKTPAIDYATFYCAVTGSLEQEYPFSTPKTEIDEQINFEQAEEIFSETMACDNEAPVGEIIDRTLRIGGLLIIKFNKVIELDKKLYDAVDKLQVLISQCSSQRGCERRCFCFSCLCRHSHNCATGCQGWIYGCADSSGSYPAPCKPRDEDTPCPYAEIKKQLEEIQKIWQSITDLMNDKEGGVTLDEKFENIGIRTLINELIPNILKELESNVRYPMKHCVGEPGKQNQYLLKCSSTKGATAPSGEEIFYCCPISYIENGQNKQSPFGDCSGECYLERTQTLYRKCLQSCLERKSSELGDEDLRYCLNNLNFYCCNAE